MRIGIYGGSFNPIHNGHLHLIQVALAEFDLEKIILMPAKVSPFKQGEKYPVTDAQRFTMCQLAVADFPQVEVSDLELQRDGVSYTVFTIEEMHKRYPDAELIFLMGSDMFLSFERWYQWEKILSMASLGIISRETDDWGKLRQQQEKLESYGNLYLGKCPAYPLSSTEIREKIKKNEDFYCYLPKNVVQYIHDAGLYLEP